MKQYVFHTFRMGDVEDPELYAAPPILEWQKTEQGCWVMAHCPDPQCSPAIRKVRPPSCYTR